MAKNRKNDNQSPAESLAQALEGTIEREERRGEELDQVAKSLGISNE